MAAYNFTLAGLASVVNFGKGNATIVGASATQLRARDNANAADVNMSGAAAVAANDFVIKSQLDAAILGLSWKEPVRAASTANVTIAAPGASLDGVALVLGDRVLLKNQTAAIENGIYVFDTAATPLVRATDMAAGSDATNAAMFVSEGTTQADQAYVETGDPAIVGTDPLTFLQFASVSAGVTSIATAAGVTGITVLESGAAPVPTVRGILGESTVLVASLSGTDVLVSVVALGITGAKIANSTITEGKLAAGVAVLYRYLQVTFADFPGTPGSTNLALGATMPANSFVQGGVVLVTTAFDNGVTLQIGVAADLDAVFAATENDLAATGTYQSSKASIYAGATALLARVTTVTAAPTVGVAELKVDLARVA